MLRKFLKKMMPDHSKLREDRYLRLLGTLLHDPRLWLISRRSAAGAFAVGLFIAWIPLPSQMLLAAMVAILLRVNLPLSVGLVWFSNPLTMPPLFYFAYLIGAAVLQLPANDFTFELSWEWLMEGMLLIWKPFLLGCLIMGILSSLIGYFTILGLWRLHLVSAWRRRREKRRLQREGVVHPSQIANTPE
ncbi:MAG: DUF2062 domain-containing protein [Gammaproteobacteria bacterium]|nr:DUF2062 domain-containing protein [Gammaproteobacteria bacterium]